MATRSPSVRTCMRRDIGDRRRGCRLARRVLALSTRVHFRITRARWLELLDQVGGEVGIVVRVPSSLTDSVFQPPPAASTEDAASLSRAAARTCQARAELRGTSQWDAVAAAASDSSSCSPPSRTASALSNSSSSAVT